MVERQFVIRDKIMNSNLSSFKNDFAIFDTYISRVKYFSTKEEVLNIIKKLSSMEDDEDSDRFEIQEINYVLTDEEIESRDAEMDRQNDEIFNEMRYLIKNYSEVIYE